jgi:hypothetical protein
LLKKIWFIGICFLKLCLQIFIINKFNSKFIGEQIWQQEREKHRDSKKLGLDKDGNGQRKNKEEECEKIDT